jgi:hypothetical protein
MAPYQLATGKNGSPLAVGKPFIHNFLPVLGDMLRLNMAVPVTQRNDPKFSTLGLVGAAVLGLTDPAYNGNKNLQFIPNMDGFPNGRRLEDDVTRIELQAVSGVVLAAIGLWYDDYMPNSSPSPVTTGLTNVLGYTTGVEANDTTFRGAFPYLQTPWNGYSRKGDAGVLTGTGIESGLGMSADAVGSAYNFPNPFENSTTLRFRTVNNGHVLINIYAQNGSLVKKLVDENLQAGTHDETWNNNVPSGLYFAKVYSNGKLITTIKMVAK